MINRLRQAVCVTTIALLAGCAAPPNATAIHRNPNAIIAGTLRFDAARFAGDWVTVSCIGTCAARQTFATQEDAYQRWADGQSADYVITAPGVMRREGADERLVVMWVDTGFRTAAIGDADGRWAAILDRSSTPGPDRVAAAAEILDFNGWDTGQLRKVQ